MNKTLTVLKINILALAALPLLLLAIVFKLIGRSMTRIPLFIGLLIAFSGIVWIADSSKEEIMEALSDAFLYLVITVMFLVLLAVIFFVIVAFIGGLFMAVWIFIASCFEGLYNLCYNGYFSLYISCTSDYQVLSLNGKKTLNGFICPFYSILRGLSWALTTIVFLMLPIAGVFSIGLIGYTLFDLNRNTKMAFGMNLIRFIKNFSTLSMVGGILIYLLLMAIPIIAIIVIALDAYEWLQELKMTGEMVSENISGIQEIEIQAPPDELSESEDYAEYFNTIEKHLSQLDSLGKKVQEILDKKQSPQLQSSWGSYMRNLEDLAEKCSAKNTITVKKFKRMIPQIKQLDKQRENVRKLTDKLSEELRNPAGSSIFFAGCDTPEKLEKRYKSLCKTYHPDVGGGDKETFQKMQAEYESIKAVYSEGSQAS